MKLLCLLALIFACCIRPATAQTIPDEYPKQADLGVNGIYLSFKKSTEDIVSPRLSFVSQDEYRERASCNNSDGTQVMTLIRHLRRPANSIQEFKIEKGNAQASSCKLDKVEAFETHRHIKLGMPIADLTNELGKGFQVESVTDAVTLKYTIESNQYSPFLRYYNERHYYAEYTFKSGKLVHFQFGFDPRF